LGKKLKPLKLFDDTVLAQVLVSYKTSPLILKKYIVFEFEQAVKYIFGSLGRKAAS
jgi:hypothetical protein